MRSSNAPGRLSSRFAFNCSLVSETRPTRWEDTTPAVFARTFDDTVRRIEAAAIEAAVETNLTPEERNSMAALGQGRLRAVFGMLTSVVGKEEAARLANEAIRELGRGIKS